MARDATELLALGALLAAKVTLVAAVWWSVRAFGRRSRDAQRMASLALAGDAAGAEAVVADLAPAAAARTLAAAAGVLATRAAPPPSGDDDALPEWASDEGFVDDDGDGAEGGGPGADDGAPDGPEVDRDAAPPPPGPEARAALDLLARAVGRAPGDGPTLVAAAEALGALGRLEDLARLVGHAVAAPGLDPTSLSTLARHALALGAAGEALALCTRARAARPDDLEALGTWAEALLALDRPGEAAPALRAALDEVRRRRESIHFVGSEQELHALEERLAALHDEAVRLDESAEQVVGGHLARLDPHAGVNHRLVAHALLVESARPARRLFVPSQEDLRRVADDDAADPAAREEDQGLLALRAGDLDGAERAFRAAAARGPDAWPALLGLGATLDLRRGPGLARLPAVEEPPGLAALVVPWAALTEVERRLVALALAPVAARVPALVAGGARLLVAALDARLTDLEPFRAARGVLVADEDDRRTHDAIDGMAVGPVAAIKVEALLLREEDGWTVAHELGHALHALAGAEARAEAEALFAVARREAWRSTGYGLRDVFEFFATGYERFALRAAFPAEARGEVHAADVDLGVDAFFRRFTAGG